MSIADLFFEANQQLVLSDLEPITKEVYEAIDKTYWEGECATYSYDQWKEALEAHGYDPARIKKTKNPHAFRTYFYEGDYFTPNLFDLDPSYLGQPLNKSCLKADEIGKKEFAEGNYTVYFFPEWNSFAIDYFIRYYDQIPTEKRWEVFELIYTIAEYGFQLFPKEIIEDVFSLADKTQTLQLLKEEQGIEHEEYVTIYRGEGLRSTPVEQAYSWTFSYDIAYRFAFHRGAGRVYEAKVFVSDIIFYTNDRNEEEVLVRYENLVDVSTIADTIEEE